MEFSISLILLLQLRMHRLICSSFYDLPFLTRGRRLSTITHRFPSSVMSAWFLPIIFKFRISFLRCNFQAPLMMSGQSMALGCCCGDGVIEISITINRGCFVPGETMRIDGEIVNRTNSDIKHSTIALVQVGLISVLRLAGELTSTDILHMKRCCMFQ